MCKSTKEIDRQFRPGWDFLVVWGFLTIPGMKYAFQWIETPWYSVVAFAIVVPFIFTFAIYGPVLLVRQIIKSGSRGYFVARVFLSVILTLSVLFAILYFTGKKPDTLFIALISVGSNLYLHRRIGQG